jgi:hypothetical protein
LKGQGKGLGKGEVVGLMISLYIALKQNIITGVDNITYYQYPGEAEGCGIWKIGSGKASGKGLLDEWNESFEIVSGYGFGEAKGSGYEDEGEEDKEMFLRALLAMEEEEDFGLYDF